LIFSFAALKAQSAKPPVKPVAKPALKPGAVTPPVKAVPGVRMKFQDFVKDPHRLDSLIRAIATMKSKSTAPPTSAEYRASWEYWSAMHGFFGPGAKAGLVQNARNAAPTSKKPFFDGIRDLTFPATPPGLAQSVWDKCTHGNLQFLVWHRVYLFYFEKVLQASAGDNSLRLPYWDYTDPAQVQLPAAFANPTLSDGKPNPLYDKRRRSQTVKLDPDITDIDDLLKESDFGDFSPDLEQQPHGTTHCSVGPDCPYPLMGKVAVAATDPIFWLHHANIDRIFECWIQLGGKTPSDLLSKDYPFLDPAGNPVHNSVKNLPIDYTYDHVTNCGRTPTSKFKLTLAAAAPEMVAKVQGFAINDATTSVKLAVPKTGAPAQHLKGALGATAAASAPSRTVLALTNIQVPQDPGTLINIYLSTTGANPRREYVATLSFFGLEHHAGTVLNRKVDVTSALRALKGTSADLPEIQVVFEATDGTAGSKVEAVRPLFNKQSGLKIGTIELDLKKK
jgi:hypothetical protein